MSVEITGAAGGGAARIAVRAGLLAGLLGMAFAAAGCASVVRGSDEAVAFSSEPAAAVQLSSGQSCPQTPCELTVPRKQEFTATFTKPGFEPQTVAVTTRISGAGVATGAGNLLAGGVIGIGVDAYNGANLDHTPNPVFARLAPAAAPAAPAAQRRTRKKPAPVS